MPPISTKLHAAGDYAGGALLLAAPRLLLVSDRRVLAALRASGGATLATSSATDYELGIVRRIPMPAHLAIDAATGALMLLGARSLRRRRNGARNWLPLALLGLGEIAVAALTERQPADRPDKGAQTWQPRAPSQTEPTAAMPPTETPGPSVTVPAMPETDVERTERVDEVLRDAHATDDVFVAQQEAAAAAAAAGIGGLAPSASEDPAMDPVYQAGGGEQDGWEAAEEDLIESATHGDTGGDPTRDAFRAEVEADRVTAVYGEGDHVDSTELLDDAATGPDDPGAGPGRGSERGEDAAPGKQPPG